MSTYTFVELFSGYFPRLYRVTVMSTYTFPRRPTLDHVLKACQGKLLLQATPAWMGSFLQVLKDVAAKQIRRSCISRSRTILQLYQ